MQIFSSSVPVKSPIRINTSSDELSRADILEILFLDVDLLAHISAYALERELSSCIPMVEISVHEDKNFEFDLDVVSDLFEQHGIEVDSFQAYIVSFHDTLTKSSGSFVVSQHEGGI